MSGQFAKIARRENHGSLILRSRGKRAGDALCIRCSDREQSGVFADLPSTPCPLCDSLREESAHSSTARKYGGD
jgi:hypothetical protein